MKNAPFQLKNYCIHKLNFDFEKLEGGGDSTLNILFKPYGVYTTSKNSFQLFLDCNINLANNDSNLISLSIKSLFIFKENITFETIPEYFYTNAPAIIFPYIRAYLSIISSQANIPGIILPILNLTNLNQELKENTIRK